MTLDNWLNLALILGATALVIKLYFDYMGASDGRRKATKLAGGAFIALAVMDVVRMGLDFTFLIVILSVVGLALLSRIFREYEQGDDGERLCIKILGAIGAVIWIADTVVSRIG